MRDELSAIGMCDRNTAQQTKRMSEAAALFFEKSATKPGEHKTGERTIRLFAQTNLIRTSNPVPWLSGSRFRREPFSPLALFAIVSKLANESGERRVVERQQHAPAFSLLLSTPAFQRARFDSLAVT